jgi:hypothetical protein
MNKENIELTEVNITISKDDCEYCYFYYDMGDKDFCGLFMDYIGWDKLPECKKLGGGKFLLAKIKEVNDERDKKDK